MDRAPVKRAVSNELKMSPVQLVLSYYRAVEDGDLNRLQTIMTQDSYAKTIEAFSFKISFQDPGFKQLLKKASEDVTAMKKVESILSDDLKKVHESHEISIVDTEHNGINRTTVNYRDNGKQKKLYFSFFEGKWLIDYMAGRRV